jgi:hypothetical protein
MRNGRPMLDPIRPPHRLFVQAIKDNRARGNLDRVQCNKGKLTYECVWHQANNNGPWMFFSRLMCTTGKILAERALTLLAVAPAPTFSPLVRFQPALREAPSTQFKCRTTTRSILLRPDDGRITAGRDQAATAVNYGSRAIRFPLETVTC